MSSNLTELSYCFFSGCSSLETITLPEGITTISEKAFGYCDNLQSVTIPSSIVNIDRDAFYGSENVIICGTEGSYAEKFANGVGIPFNAPVVTIKEEKIWTYDEDDESKALILYINQSRTLRAEQKPANLARTLAWSSSNTEVVTVDQNGIITGISQGIAAITVNTADGKGRAAQMKVVVPEPTEIRIDDDWDKEDYEIILGQTMTISAETEVPFQDKTKIEMSVDWSSSDSTIISVESLNEDECILRGNNLGKATITATTRDRGKASVELEVVRPEAENIKIDQNGPIRLYPDERYALTATVLPAEAEARLTWYSYDKEIATVNQDGIVTAVETGETEIYVETDDELVDSIDIHVLTPPQTITLSKTKATLAMGDTFTLESMITPDDAETGLTWSSSKPSVAKVNKNGKVTALKPGKAKITVATDNGKSASAVITVKAAPTRVKLSKTKATLGVKEQLTLKTTLSPSKAYTTLTWRSSDKTVASVTQKGVVTPKKPGTAVITVSTRNGKTAKATITVKAAPKSVTLNKSGTVELAKGKQLKLKATLPKNTASALTWKSSKPKVASVDKNGVVTAKAKGTAVITVHTFNGKEAQVTISVK